MRFVFIFLLTGRFLLASGAEVLEKIQASCPKWMRAQIEEDLAPYRDRRVSIQKCDLQFSLLKEDCLVLRFSINGNEVSLVDPSGSLRASLRAAPYLEALRDLCKVAKLPDLVFYITMHDGITGSCSLSSQLNDLPIFAMSRFAFGKEAKRSILVPDFEALCEGYQVLEGRDLRSLELSWKGKQEKLVWRGSTTQRPLDLSNMSCAFSEGMTRENAHYCSRYTICQQSLEFPEIIDAKYTYLGEHRDTFPEVSALEGERMSYIDQLRCKYHIILHGNAAAYTRSCWKLFANSVVFMPDTPWEQWYYNALVPYVHYVPVKGDLADLPERVLWAIAHDELCEGIAKNARDFAVHNLTRSDHLLYLYHLLLEYSQVLCE